MAAVVNPLHPDFVSKLDPEYVAFYNEHLAHKLGPHQIPWDPSIRNAPAVLGGAEPLRVGHVKDISLSKCKVRVFTPEGATPTAGWPVFLFYHGGGWTLGTIDAENSFSTNMCKRAKCVVVSVDYRLGPEQPYPAAVDDAMEALEWVYANGKAQLAADLSRLAVGGSSSGGNLAAIVTHKAAIRTDPISLIFQLLIVPVTDNTAAPDGKLYHSWLENANTAALSPEKMIWFRNNYVPNKEDWAKWECSPIYAPEKAFAKAPRAWIAVAQLDILRDEGIAYGEKLREAGVEVEVKVYQRAPHPIMAMDGVLQVGKQLVSDAAEALGKALGTL